MRRRSLDATLVAAVALAVAAVLLPRPPYLKPVSLEEYERVTKGMSLAEVETTFGRPPGGPSGPYRWLTPRNNTPSPPEGGEVYGWVDEESDICVYFDASGRVVDKDRYGIGKSSFARASKPGRLRYVLWYFTGL
jgi:hypothetical protein